MNASPVHFEFAPPPEAGSGRSIGLALLVHLLLVLALTWGVHWQDQDNSMAVEAELWSAIPTPAAPKAVEPEPPPPPQPKPAPPPPPPKVVPKPTPPVAQREAQLAIDKEKQKKLEKEKKLEEERQKQKEKDLKDKKEKEKKLEEERQKQKDKELKDRKEKLEKEKLEKEKLAKHKAEQEAKERAENKRLEAQRQENLKRITGMAGASGAPTDTGTALKASGPSASYAGRVRGKVKPNIVFADDLPGNPMAEVEVKCAPDGTILSTRLLKSSGHKAWDDAVIKALEKTEVLPRDLDGRVPPLMVISFRPKD